MNKTDFGFKQIPKEEKISKVRGVFESVASKYDIMNDAMSLGLHRAWKHEFVSGLRLNNGSNILDLAGGTGDISFRILKRNRNISITIADINEAMLDEGKKRALDNGFVKGVEWSVQNAEQMSFAENSFDIVTMAFGIRNVTNKEKALSEIFRVLKPGGHFHCLEFVPETPFQKIYDTYSFNIIPKIGGMITGDSDAYQYLVESIRMFPKPETFKKMMEEAGFLNVSYSRPFPFVCAIHKGFKA